MDILPRRGFKTFIDDDFLLSNEFSKVLFHDYAKNLPIIDYHNHLPPEQISKNKVFENITEIWLNGDHYKWRAMRTMGIDEKFITGNSTDFEKFQKWAQTVPYTMRNPLYHWTQMELQRYFGIEELLDQDNAIDIYNFTSKKVSTPEFSTQSLLSKMNVEAICTTDDPCDNLLYHKEFKFSNSSFEMFPAFRPDKAFTIESPENYETYLNKLATASGNNIQTYDDLLQSLYNRVDYFHENGCRLADHGLEKLYYFKNSSLDPQLIFHKVNTGHIPTDEEVAFFKYRTLLELCKMYHSKGWTQQFHLGALRNNNSRMYRQLGPDTGFDSIGDFSQAASLSGFLNELDKTDQLAKTILYNLNPSDNEVMATMTGNFNNGTIKGKIQFGSGWWFLDQKDGMEAQMNTLSNMGLISCFVGMLTDSRSFLSFPRHEYFRRVLCNLFGKDIQNGELPNDEKMIGKIIQDICYYNAKGFFQFPKI